MIRLVVLVIALLAVVSVVVTIILSLLFMLAMACAIGLPLYFIGRHLIRESGLKRPAQNSMEHLKNLYIEGKIDLFEFERRVAHLLAVEHY